VLAGFAEGVALVSIAVDKYVVGMADNFSKMAYASQQMNTSVRNLQTVEFAARAVGVSGDAAAAGLQNMARAIRSNPGLNGLLGGLGIKPGQDTSRTQSALYHRIAKMPRYMALQIAGQFGLDSDTTNQVLNNLPEYDKAQKAHEARMRKAGLNPDDDAKRAVEFERNLNTLEDDVDILKEIIGSKFLPLVDKLVRGMTVVAGVMTTHPNLTAFGGLAGLLGGGWAAKKVTGWGLRKIGTSIGLRGGAAAGELAEGGAGGAAVIPFVVPIVVGVLAALGIAWVLKKSGALDKMQKFGEAHSVASVFHAATSKAGWQAEGTAAMGFVSWLKSKEGLRHRLYGSLEGGAASIGYGHKLKPGEHFGSLTTEQANALFQSDLAAAGGVVSKLTKGLNLSQGWRDALTDYQFNSGNLAGAHILLRKLRAGDLDGAARAFELYGGYHDGKGGFHPGGSDAISTTLLNRRLGDEKMARGVSINQKTDIHVTGGSDPEATGRSVMRTQKHVNADLARNAAGAPG